MSADSPNDLDLQPAEPSVADRALMDRLDAWSRGELHDMRAPSGPGGLPSAMVEDMRRVRLVRNTILGAGVVVLALLMFIALLIAHPMTSASREAPAPSNGSAGVVYPMDDHTLGTPRASGATPPSVRQLQRMNPDFAVEQLVLPEPDGSVAVPSRGTRPAP